MTSPRRGPRRRTSRSCGSSATSCGGAASALMFTGRNDRPRRRRRQRGVRRRRDVRVLRQPGHQHLLGADRHAGHVRAATRATARSSTTPATATACSSSASSSATTSIPEVGFVRRDDMRRTSAQLRFSPRPRDEQGRPQVLVDRIDRLHRERRAAGSRRATADAEFAIEFQNGDRFKRRLQRHLRVPAGAVPHRARASRCPSAATTSTPCGVGFNRGQQRRGLRQPVCASTAPSTTATRPRSASSSGRLNLTPQLSVEPSYSVNWVDLVEGSFTTHLVGSRVTYTLTPRMFVSALLQYNSSNHAMAANVRLRWEYQPGQRAVRRLQRGAGHARTALPGPRQPRVHREDQPALTLLSHEGYEDDSHEGHEGHEDQRVETRDSTVDFI